MFRYQVERGKLIILCNLDDVTEKQFPPRLWVQQRREPGLGPPEEGGVQGAQVRVHVCTVQWSQNRFLLRRKESGLARKTSDAALYGFNKPQDIEDMRPEKEPLVIEDDSIPSGNRRMPQRL